MIKSGDTIAARATPPGRGGIAVLRVSGPAAAGIALKILGTCPPARQAVLLPFLDRQGAPIDTGIAIYFPAPRSYTGEDVLELHAHGGTAVTELLLERLGELGARLARPGEFTERAFLNDKLDLLQAEAVADLIDAGSRGASRAARRSLEGRFSEAIHGLNEQVTGLRTYVEAAIDFPDEELDLLKDDELQRRLKALEAEFNLLQRTIRQGRLLRDGVQVVLAGRPNSGKSSLLNALAGHAAAIVSDQPGTTRDLVREHLEIDGLPLHIVDTAGLRDPTDPIEREGVSRARGQLEAADLALLVTDASLPDELEPLLQEFPAGVPTIIVRNKIDLTREEAGAGEAGSNRHLLVRVSALTGAGLDALRAAIKAGAGFEDPGESTVIARQRHQAVLARAREHFDAGRRELMERGAGELLAQELLAVQNALAEITGEFTSDDLLGRIFASFCIGK